MATLTQYNTSLQPVRSLDIKINVLDYDMQIMDEISGVTTQATISIDSDSDIRRTVNISMIIHANSMPTGVQSIDIGTIWTAGNPYWFDKYVQIYIGIAETYTKEIVWVNQGIYLINSPSINYDASTSELSFSGVDLMAKLTGIRNGHLEGMTYQINAGDSITGAMRAILEEQGFMNAIIKEPPTTEVPNDISVDAGGTAYDLLSQLRDINPNWEMFFDVDGVFYFQPIPQSTPTESPLVDDTVWDELAISYSLDTSFEDVKNYVEVIGKTIETDEVVTPVINGNTLTITLAHNFSSYYSTVEDFPITWRFGFTLGDLTLSPVLRSDDIYNLIIKDASNATETFTIPQGCGVWYTNQSYFVAMTVDDEGVTNGEVGGYTQIKAIAFEDNLDSPFYVGDVKSGVITTEAGGDVSWGHELNVLTTVTPTAYTTDAQTQISTATLNVSPWVDFTNASVNASWRLYLNLSLASVKVSLLNITANGYTNASLALTNTDGDDVSADYKDATYVLELTKASASTMTATLYYISIPASNWETPTTKIYSLPKFSKMVRGVCSGDEYDNIYTNDLASQRAKYEIYLKARLHDTLNLTNVPLYWLDVNTLISYTLPNDIYHEPTLWMIKSISTDLSVSGTQSITAMRFYPLYAEGQIDWSRVMYLTDSAGNYIIDSEGKYITVSRDI